MFSYEICELFKNTFFYRSFPVAASKNNEQQQLSEGFANVCYKMVSPILQQELINDFAICKHCSAVEHFYLLLKIVTILETSTPYFK